MRVRGGHTGSPRAAGTPHLLLELLAASRTCLRGGELLFELLEPDLGLDVLLHPARVLRGLALGLRQVEDGLGANTVPRRHSRHNAAEARARPAGGNNGRGKMNS